MALKKCKECGKEVSSKATACVGCGAPLAKKKSSTLARLFLFVMIGFTVLAVVAANRGPHPRSASASPSTPAAPKAPKFDGQGSWAWEHAKTLVRASLKSPSTAEFPSWGWSEHVAYRGDGLYEMHLPVDSQNSFGATLRTDFYVTLRLNGGEPHAMANWKVEKFEFR